MEDEQDCGYDYIEVFSGYDDAGPSYGRFCGNKVNKQPVLGLVGANPKMFVPRSGSFRIVSENQIG